MNRIILVGNGFDLAHGLPTKYSDFVNWYWEQRLMGLANEHGMVSKDALSTFKIADYGWSVYLRDYHNKIFVPNPASETIASFIADKARFRVSISPFFDSINKCLLNKGWVDIENEFYTHLKAIQIGKAYDTPIMLNQELEYMRDLLAKYLLHVQQNSTDCFNEAIKQQILSPILPREVSVEAAPIFNQFALSRFDIDQRQWPSIWKDFGYDDRTIHSASTFLYSLDKDKKEAQENGIESVIDSKVPKKLLIPEKVMLLNFNYTNIADKYIQDNDIYSVNHIHGELKDPKNMIFGYGDELDSDYQKIVGKNDNEYLRNMKNAHYSEKPSYREMLSFLDSSPYQIYIMGHSCGNSDRTLLNTLFEHKNCISIKPFYYKQSEGKDNYLDIVQNISRNFTDMKLMRDRVVNKTFCEPLGDPAL